MLEVVSKKKNLFWLSFVVISVTWITGKTTMWNAAEQWLVWLITRPMVMIFWSWSQIIRMFNGRPPIPPVSNPLLLYSATELARLIRSRKISCREVIEAYIERVREVNPIINAVVQDRFDQALYEASLVDKSLASSGQTEEELARDTPLLGVPITIKESIAVSGMSHNAGVPGQFRVAPKDSTAVACLRAAGAIPILVSNTPELCLCWETYNPVTGRTNNPYDARLTPGGSSGGEAALIGSAASVVGLGSDIGGSGRLPASFCGIFGHKPSSEYIVVDAHMPSSHDPSWTKVFVYAPMSRYAEDLPLVLKASVSDKEKLKELRLDEPVDLKNLRYFFLEKDGSKFTANVHRDIRTALHKAISHVEDTYKVSFTKLEVKDYKHTPQLSFFLLLRMEACHSIFQKTAENLTEWGSVTWQALKWLLGLSPHALHAIMYGVFRKMAMMYPKRAMKEMECCRDSVKKQLNDILGDNGVLLLPTYPTTAHPHMQVYYQMLNAGYVSLFNMVDMPSTACPIMRNRAGVPVGIQVVAARGKDRLTLAVAREMERVFGGWVPPTGADMTGVKTTS